MAPLLVLGTGILAVEVADLAADAGFEVAGFVEADQLARCAEPLEDLPVIWIDELPPLAATHLAVAGVPPRSRRSLCERAAAAGIGFATIVHPAARVSSRSTVGEGSIVSAGAVVAARTSIGRHVFLNRGSLVGHHTTVGDYATVLPGASVAGGCTVGEGAFIGMGALVLDYVTVGEGAVAGAGVVVAADLPAGASQPT